jgi:ankyrin repeat protein
MTANFRVSILGVVLLSFSMPGQPVFGSGNSNDRVSHARSSGRLRVQQRAGQNQNSAIDGTTPLHRAAERGDIDEVRRLTKSGANVNGVNRYGVSAIMLACSNGDAAIIQWLLDAGADVNASSPEGQTCLMSAAATGNLPATKVLLIHGADVNATEKWKGQTALMWAVAEGHASVAETLVEAGADVQARSKNGFTALLFAVRQGSIDAVRVLLKAGVSVNENAVADAVTSNQSARATDRASALVTAIINAHYELAALLLENGADPNAADARGSALHALAWMRKPGAAPTAVPPLPTGRMSSGDLAKALLERGANPNVRLSWQEIPFDRDDGETKSPPNIATGRDFISLLGATPFFLAAKNGDVEFMRLLVVYKADPLLGTLQNVTPLMAAAGFGYWAGETPGPLSGTSESDRLDAVKLAFQLGGDVNAVADFGDFNIEGNGLELLWTYPKNLEQLFPAVPGDVRWTGSTALHGAPLTNQPSIIEFLVEKGAKLDVKNRLGWTPLMVAEGLLAGATSKRSPLAEAVIRRLMAEQGIDPTPYSQRRASPDVSPRVP